MKPLEGKIVYGTNDKDYREFPALNNSLLTSISRGLSEFRRLKGIDMSEEEIRSHRQKAAFRKGSALDCMLTMPSQFAEFFIRMPKFNDNSMDALLIREWVKRGNTKFNVEGLFELSNEMKLWKSIKRKDLRIAKFNNKFCKDKLLPYYRSYENKTVITEEEYATVLSAVKELVKDSYVNNIINPQKGIILYTQLMVRGVEKVSSHVLPEQEVALKGLLDFVTVDTNNKTITPDDLKSTGKSASEDFKKSFLDYGYITQASLYSRLLENWRDEMYPGYTIKPFGFIVKSLTHLKEPVVRYEVTEELLQIGRYGGNIWKKRVLGWEELIHMYLEQEQTGQYYLTPEMYRQQNKLGSVKLDYGNVEANSFVTGSANINDDGLVAYSAIGDDLSPF